MDTKSRHLHLPFPTGTRRPLPTNRVIHRAAATQPSPLDRLDVPSLYHRASGVSPPRGFFSLHVWKQDTSILTFIGTTHNAENEVVGYPIKQPLPKDDTIQPDVAVDFAARYC